MELHATREQTRLVPPFDYPPYSNYSVIRLSFIHFSSASVQSYTPISSSCNHGPSRREGSTARLWYSAQAPVDPSQPDTLRARHPVGQDPEGGLTDGTLPALFDLRASPRCRRAQNPEYERPGAHCLPRHTNRDTGYEGIGWVQFPGIRDGSLPFCCLWSLYLGYSTNLCNRK